ncbi:DoxX family protein [Pseudomonas savastanoi]|uniref:DoxD-like protein n=1 Tax=Pseudomonas savastanoi pv. glycinea TaxID=318 RepID=A0AB74AW33_PSESG|nr:DoxX family protein [Pseudomonas savastanoi]RMQ05428.1 DoxD-like protein [Pseudomonas savastanoi pv. glycinea]
MNTMIKSVLNTRAGYGLTLLRVIVGIAFIAHGSQKLFGAFGGYGLEGTAQYMESLGLTPGYLMALMSGSAEFFGGLGLLLGLLARPAAVVVILLLLVAIFTVHIHNGFFMADSVEKVGFEFRGRKVPTFSTQSANNGYEYALALLGGALAVLIEGAGKLSLDRVISR